MNRCDMDLASAIDAFMAGHPTATTMSTSGGGGSGLLGSHPLLSDNVSSEVDVFGGGFTLSSEHNATSVGGVSSSNYVAAPSSAAANVVPQTTEDAMAFLSALLLEGGNGGQRLVGAQSGSDGGGGLLGLLADEEGTPMKTAIHQQEHNAQDEDQQQPRRPPIVTELCDNDDVDGDDDCSVDGAVHGDLGALLTAGIDMSDAADAELMGLLMRRKPTHHHQQQQQQTMPTATGSKQATAVHSDNYAADQQQRQQQSLAYFQRMFPNLSQKELSALQQGSSVAISVGGDDDIDDGVPDATRRHAFKPAAVSQKQSRLDDGVDDIETDDEGFELDDGVNSAAAAAAAAPTASSTSRPLVGAPRTEVAAPSLATAMANSHVDPSTAVLLAGLQDAAYRGGRGSGGVAQNPPHDNANGEATDGDGVEDVASAGNSVSRPVKPTLNNLFTGGGVGDGAAAADGASSDDDDDALTDAALAMMLGEKAAASSVAAERAPISAAGRPRRLPPKGPPTSSLPMAATVDAEEDGQVTENTCTAAPSDMGSAAAAAAPTMVAASAEGEGEESDEDDADEDLDPINALPDATDDAARLVTCVGVAAVSDATTSIMMAAAATPKLSSAKEVPGLQALVEECDDAVVPMCLDPSFDYDANINGFTSRFGELIRQTEKEKKERERPTEASAAADEETSAPSFAVPESIRAAARAHDALLDRKPAAVAGAAASSHQPAPAKSKFESLFLNQSDPFDAPPPTVAEPFSEHNQLIGGQEEDEGGDAVKFQLRTQTGDDASARSLLGGVDEGNADDDRIVGMIMQWAKNQK